MQKWEYVIAYCWFEEKCKLCLDDRKKPQAHWVLDISDNKHHWLESGLKEMGAQGWELVGLHQIWRAYGGTVSSNYITYWYVFKRPMDH